MCGEIFVYNIIFKQRRVGAQTLIQDEEGQVEVRGWGKAPSHRSSEAVLHSCPPTSCPNPSSSYNKHSSRSRFEQAAGTSYCRTREQTVNYGPEAAQDVLMRRGEGGEKSDL